MSIKEKMITIKISERNAKWIKKYYPKAKRGVSNLFEYGGIDIQEAHAIADILYHTNEAFNIEGDNE
tara:strand:+ start:181 stop:381 length:201 start_codon:yes stop_codon:yes gene_type:complete